MQWEQLLCNARLSGDNYERHDRTRFNQDYGRVLYSGAFRRLQDKTQVFPLGRNDYVRTRLTHSLEVANVGGTLAMYLADIIRKHEGVAATEALPLAEMKDIVATACLAHDIGNPPFGHSGEKAIENALEGTEFAGFSFEGNAQGFRLLTRTCDPIRGCGLDLTVATLGAFTKYPCTRSSQQDAFYHKFGINEGEKEIFARVAESCGLQPLARDVWARHPLAFLMEAADDISYLIADIEDAFVSRIISYDDARGRLGLLAAMDSKTLDRAEAEREAHGETAAIRFIRAVAVGRCLRALTETMDTRYDDIMHGRLLQSLTEASSLAPRYEVVKDYSVQRIYRHESVVKVEITGYNIISRLMELFLEWVEAPKSNLGRKIGAVLHADPAASAEKEARFLHVIDYVSGMTDSYALQSYKSLFGLDA